MEDNCHFLSNIIKSINNSNSETSDNCCRESSRSCRWLKLNNSQIVELNLTNFNLSGSISNDIQFLTSLEKLDLHRNNLTGPIPPELGELSELNYLDLSNNGISGTIPTSLGNLTRLNTLDLHNNKLDGNIPPELGNLKNISYLLLNGNRLSGYIPSNWSSLKIRAQPQCANDTAVPGFCCNLHGLCGQFPENCGTRSVCDISPSIPENSSTGMSNGTLIGIVLGALAATFLLIFASVYYLKRKRSVNSIPWIVKLDDNAVNAHGQNTIGSGNYTHQDIRARPQDTMRSVESIDENIAEVISLRSLATTASNESQT